MLFLQLRLLLPLIPLSKRLTEVGCKENLAGTEGAGTTQKSDRAAPGQLLRVKHRRIPKGHAGVLYARFIEVKSYWPSFRFYPLLLNLSTAFHRCFLQ